MTRPAARPRLWSRLAILAAILPMLLAPPPAWAWGRQGHRIIARLAEPLLTKTARNAIRDLLPPGESLADASTWADDEGRRTLRNSGPWHYVNVPISEERYSNRFCSDRGCVVTKIADYRRVLADRRAPKARRLEALRFLVHFVQDIHQPLHVGDRNDKGGNDTQVQLFGQPTNLHRAWDSDLIRSYERNETRYVERLKPRLTPEMVSAWGKSSVEDWATESLAAAKLAYLSDDGRSPLRSGDRIGEPYAQRNRRILEDRLVRAAARLATELNALFPESDKE